MMTVMADFRFRVMACNRICVTAYFPPIYRTDIRRRGFCDRRNRRFARAVPPGPDLRVCRRPGTLIWSVMKFVQINDREYINLGQVTKVEASRTPPDARANHTTAPEGVNAVLTV